MTNLVTVTIAVDNSPADLTSAEGYYVLSPSGVMWPDTSGNPVAPMVHNGHLVNGTASEQLVASDNYAAGVLTWDVIINVRGLPTVNVASVPVNFANGASQNIWTILQAAGWTPATQP
jgi:hypothetical protein